METHNINIVFAYFHNDIFKGFRADTMGTLSFLKPKIYKYTEKQIEIIKKNTQYELSHQGVSFFKQLFNKGFTPINIEDQILEKDAIIKQVNDSEEEKRNWGEFELRVYPIPFYYDEYEEWKMEAFNANLPEPLEIHKFKTINDEN